MKQKHSSVNWLAIQLNQLERMWWADEILMSEYDKMKKEALKTAIEMHKQEIIDAGSGCGYIGGATEDEEEWYYKETFITND